MNVIWLNVRDQRLVNGRCPLTLANAPIPLYSYNCPGRGDDLLILQRNEYRLFVPPRYSAGDVMTEGEAGVLNVALEERLQRMIVTGWPKGQLSPNQILEQERRARALALGLQWEPSLRTARRAKLAELNTLLQNLAFERQDSIEAIRGEALATIAARAALAAGLKWAGHGEVIEDGEGGKVIEDDEVASAAA